MGENGQRRLVTSPERPVRESRIGRIVVGALLDRAVFRVLEPERALAT